MMSQKPGWCILVLSLASWVCCDDRLLQTLREKTRPDSMTPDGEPCECVPYSQCEDVKIEQNRGRPIQETCRDYTQVCCVRVVPVPSTCGVRPDPLAVELRQPGYSEVVSDFGEFPWTCAILLKADNTSIGVGSLIHPRVVLTVAYVLHRKYASDIKVRAGEWDTSIEKERIPYQDIPADRFVVHDKFDHSRGIYNIALIILSTPFILTQTVQPICLPARSAFVDWEENCFASGWGKDKFGLGSRYAIKMKRIRLNIVNLDACQRKLGQNLHISFICAEGRPGVNMCHGDFGAPLVCPTEIPGRYHQVGIFVFSRRCGQDSAPGVYTHVSKFRKWIDDSMKEKNLTTDHHILDYGVNIPEVEPFLS